MELNFVLKINIEKQKEMSVSISDENGKEIARHRGSCEELLLPVEYETHMPVFLGGSDTLRERINILELLILATKEIYHALRGEQSSRLTQLMRAFRGANTQRYFSEVCGVKLSQIMNLETGKGRISLKQCMEIVDAWERNKEETK